MLYLFNLATSCVVHNSSTVPISQTMPSLRLIKFHNTWLSAQRFVSVSYHLPRVRMPLCFGGLTYFRRIVRVSFSALFCGAVQ